MQNTPQVSPMSNTDKSKVKPNLLNESKKDVKSNERGSPMTRTLDQLLNLSLNIRRLRESKGWSQRELAKKLSTSHPTIVRWESPITEMSLASLEKLANVFDTSPAELFLCPTEGTPYTGRWVA